ncbi:MAG: hypothetical protein R2788_20130 [Saprospiraceae bacterium]
MGTAASRNNRKKVECSFEGLEYRRETPRNTRDLHPSLRVVVPNGSSARMVGC